MNITWDAAGYEENFSFVPTYGEGVMELIDAQAGASCLDMGCGNGMLTAELAARGYSVVGMDASPQMLALARERHPELRFMQADATDFALPEPVGVVFSNAMLHWVDRDRHPQMLACVARALMPGGQFVFECGGHACGARIHEALAHAFAARGRSYEVPFWFPTVGEYAPLLEAAGLRVTHAFLFDRPTRLQGEDGMADWIRMFVRRPFEGIDEVESELIVAAAVAELKGDLYHDGSWRADYVRLRMRAVRV